jgi:hypothetical protein
VPRIRVNKRDSGPPAPTDAEQAPATEGEGTPVRVFDLRREERVEVVDSTDEAPGDDCDGVDTGSIGPVLVLP